ncbi:MAG: hypothetical protein WD509_03150 [Candidatus Paceibacterota bacterium]
MRFTSLLLVILFLCAPQDAQAEKTEETCLSIFVTGRPKVDDILRISLPHLGFSCTEEEVLVPKVILEVNQIRPIRKGAGEYAVLFSARVFFEGRLHQEIIWSGESAPRVYSDAGISLDDMIDSGGVAEAIFAGKDDLHSLIQILSQEKTQ